MRTKTLLSLPGVAVALLPRLTCPACAPAYAAIVSSLGLRFLTSSTYLLPVVTAGLALALAGLAFRASERHGYRPLFLGALGAGLLMIGKFTIEHSAVLYSGVVLMVMAAVWNVWPHRRDAEPSCPACQNAQAKV